MIRLFETESASTSLLHMGRFCVLLPGTFYLPRGMPSLISAAPFGSRTGKTRLVHKSPVWRGAVAWFGIPSSG